MWPHEKNSSSDADARCSCRDDTRYPEVAKQRKRMQQEEEELEEMLPDLAKQAGVPELKYITFQGTEYCIEVPQNAKFPARWPKISSNKGKGTVTCQPTEVAHKVEQRDACKERLTAAAHDAWIGFLSGFSDMYGEFRHGVSALATLDCLVGLADLASTPDYTRPRMVAASEGEGGTIDVERGRHPVLESTMAEGAYVPNSTNLNSHEKRCEVITGSATASVNTYLPFALRRIIVFTNVCVQTKHGWEVMLHASGGINMYHGADWKFCAC